MSRRKTDPFLTHTLLPIPGGLVVRIRRSHRRGRGSIPRLGMNILGCNLHSVKTINFSVIFMQITDMLISTGIGLFSLHRIINN